MVYVKIVLMILFNLLIANANALENSKASPTHSLEQLYLNNVKSQSNVMTSVKEGASLGDSLDYVPIIDPPVVKKVWIPAIESEADNQVLVAGHWVYVMLKESSWKK